VRAPALAVLLALSACGAEPTTGIVVEVSSDLTLPADLELHLRVSASDGRLLRDLPFHAAQLPARLALAPESAARTTVTVEATAPVGTPPLSRRATVSFRDGALLLLRLPLEAACACVPCGADQTCEEGRCAGLLEDPAALLPYRPRADAGTGVAVPICRGDAGPTAGGGDGASAPPSDAGGDASVPLPDAPADGPPGPDAAPGLDAPKTAPDLAGAPPPDLAAPATDTAPLPRDAAADLPVTADAPLAPDRPVTADAPLAPDLPALRAEGQPCGTSDQCLSAACVDHVCCHSACVGPCLACDRLHTGVPDGQCAPVLAGSDPDNDCTADLPGSCGYDGLCDGAGACRLYGTSTLCAAATCNAASSYTPGRTCTGAGACAPPAPQDCGLYLCTPTGCPVTCDSDAACAATAYCDGSACLAQKPVATGCSRPRECRSGACSLGLCL
jgi:hypothetical protein